MWNNAVSTPEPRILILALDSGAGHRVRMERLKSGLEERGLPCQLHIISGDAEQARQVATAESSPLLVLDARDMNPAGFGQRTVLAIDNLHPDRKELAGRENILFYDTLPHPDLDDSFSTIVRQILFDEDVTERSRRERRPAIPGATRVTFYAGPQGFLSRQQIEEIDRSMTASDFILYTRVGGSADGPSTIGYMTRPRYLDLLLDTDIVLTYPGMTFWEALLLGAHPVLLETKSTVHDRLSEYLAQRIGIRWLKERERKEMTTAEMILDAMARSLSMDVEVWKRDVQEHPGLLGLVRTVEELWNDTGKRAPHLGSYS